jgi:sugar/nucleoside kinase (ribokinase family)
LSEIWTMGEILVEIMRPKPDMVLYEAGEFLGPYPSGAPAIFIDTAARLGCSAGIIGGVGDDDFGKCVLDRLISDGVNCSKVITVPGSSTAVAFVTYFKDGSRKFIYHIDNTPASIAKAVDDIPFKPPGFFHIMGCSLMINDNFYKEIIKTMKKFVWAGAKISFDPNIRVELLRNKDIQQIIAPIMEHCSVFLPGVEELLLLTGENEIDAGINKVLNNGVTEIIALKRGQQGCTVYTKNEKFNMGVYPVIPLDPTGAGDCFDAAFLCGILEDKSLIECAKYASAAAALNTAAFGPMEGHITKKSVQKMIQEEKIDIWV